MVLKEELVKSSHVINQQFLIQDAEMVQFLMLFKV